MPPAGAPLAISFECPHYVTSGQTVLRNCLVRNARKCLPSDPTSRTAVLSDLESREPGSIRPFRWKEQRSEGKRLGQASPKQISERLRAQLPEVDLDR